MSGSRRSFPRTGIIALIIAAVLVMGTCELPFGLSQVEQPAFDNPVDPESRIPVITILNATYTDGTRWIPDAVLRQVIVESGARFNSEVFSLNAEDRGVGSMEGLQYFPRLSYLNLRDNAKTGTVSDISWLFDHPGLEHLVLSGHDLSALNLSDFSNIPRLQHLDISYAGIVDAAGLEDVVGLETLELSGPDLDGTAPFPALPSIRRLVMDGTGTSPAPQTTLEFLSGCTGLETLEFRDGGLVNLTGIGVFTRLRNLALDRNSALVNIDAVTALTELESISLRGEVGVEVDVSLEPLSGRLKLVRIDASVRTGAIPIGTLTNLPALEEIELTGAGLTNADIAGLANLPALRSLNLDGGPYNFALYGDLAPLGTLPALQNLTISYNPSVVSLGGLTGASALQELHAIDIELAETEDLSFVASLPNLRILELSDETLNAGGSVTLDSFGFTALEHLYLSNIRIDGTETLRFALDLPDLQVLELHNADTPIPVVDLDNLSGTRLYRLTLENVELRSSEEFGFARYLPDLESVSISNNGSAVRPMVDLANFAGTRLHELNLIHVSPQNAADLPEGIEYLALTDCLIATTVGGGLLDEIAVNLSNLIELDLSFNPDIHTVGGLSTPASVLHQLYSLNLEIGQYQGGLSADGTVNGLAGLLNLPSLQIINIRESEAAINSLHTPADPTGVYELESARTVDSTFTS